MGARNNSWFIVSVLSFLFFFFFFFSSKTHLTNAADTDTLFVGQSLTGSQRLTSNNGYYELRIFSPGTSSNYYLGIWFRTISINSISVVWVANREQPILDPGNFKSFSELKLLENGNLVLFDQSNLDQPNILVWSTNTTSETFNSSKVVLGDDGNLILRDETNPSNVIWQSFDNPTDTWLPGGKLGFNKRTNKSQILTSWKNSEDPAPGMFSLELDPIQTQYVIRWKRSQQVWTSGAWNEQSKLFTLVPEMRLNYIYNYSYVVNENESYFTYSVLNKSLISKLVMDVSGQIKQLAWSEYSLQWNLFWSQPKEQCGVYGICGPFGICNQDTLKCDCLKGFRKRFPEDWDLSDTTGGCVRNTSLQCGKKDDFSQMRNTTKMPDNPQTLVGASAEECRVACAGNCSCNAYAYGNSGCLLWGGDLLNTQQQSNGGQDDLYLRIAASDIETSKDEPERDINQAKNRRKKNRLKFIIAVPMITLGTITMVVLVYMYLIKRKANRKGMFKGPKGLLIGLVNTKVTKKASPDENMLKKDENEEETPELQIFSIASLAIATNNFCLESKLGEGGFGPVYKGKLENGQEIAVKRLSKSSGQGIKEFRNEVILISKLQHRNLVKLLGCCTEEEEENMLIYEYMPNKSLDAFLFDPRKRGLLDWKKRFNIIHGIARGLLYLHRDSRLRVIHRDLKVSNILLDEVMNPKISDFGMARIFGGQQSTANTSRVVGTFGYMSPEYIMGGTFSEKSDVFSFGVLLLEIVSSRRNNSFYIPEQPLNLVLHTWRLWNEGKWSDIVDEALADSYPPLEVMRCIHVGLLCVQKRAVDRPTMSVVDLMLSSETDRPPPKEPPFTSETTSSESDFLRIRCTNNNVTITMVEGR